MLKLGVNIDHVATLREARYRGLERGEPDPIEAALICEAAGAHGITAHLREDRRHIQDRDIWKLREAVQTRLNLEMANAPEIVEIALKLKPDIVTLAKGITSAYFPVSASVISQKIWKVLEAASPEYGPVMHGFTYSGHPVGAALGLTNIDILESEGLVAQSAEVGAYLLKSLQERVGAHPNVGEVRGAGQMIAVEYIANKAARRFFDPKSNAHRLVSAKALELGVLTRALPFIEVTSFSPPLCMSRAEADEAVDRFGKALEAVTPELAKLAAGG